MTDARYELKLHEPGIVCDFPSIVNLVQSDRHHKNIIDLWHKFSC
jgi:hypothetical protein